jgi:hypothetical protein
MKEEERSSVPLSSLKKEERPRPGLNETIELS